ncbi:MAG TPA: PH domain-containing protein [Candidatus Saccharimonadales bacterium]|nr:PH domain-containing protein [Candidatus Saccharimonadales bacterium]
MEVANFVEGEARMVDKKSIEDQLQRIGFNQHAWGRQEVRELPNIILPDERIFECVNGIYEGGFALLVATDVRVLLIDKKPLNYLTVEDLRFDMINEIDYYHRVFGAHVDITTGNRELKFHTYNNRARLRKLIGHVQHRMADIKKRQDTHQEGQIQHLEQINEHLRTYLMAQYKHQDELRQKLEKAQHGADVVSPAPPRPSPELSDYLLAHGLKEQYEAQHGPWPSSSDVQNTEEATRQQGLLAEGLKEVFGRSHDKGRGHNRGHHGQHLDTNPLRIAYSKLPMALRNRKFGRPSLHAHSRAEDPRAAEVADVREAEAEFSSTGPAVAEPQPS